MDQNLKKVRRLAWAAAAGMTVALFLVIALCCDVRYGINDDSAILRAFMGYETGTPASFHIYIHGLLALPLHWLGCAWQTVPWFSYLQLALLFVSLLVIAKSLMQCFVNHGHSIWLGATFSALIFAAIGLEYVVTFSFTQTAAFLGAAAVLQMFSIDYERAQGKSVVIGMLGAAVLAVLAYALRQITLLPILAFCGLSFVILFWEYRHKQAKPLLISLLLIAVLLGGMVGVREVEIRANNDYHDYMAWQDANAYPIDYYGMGNLTQEELDMVGWSPATTAMAGSWCFLDSDLTTEDFQLLTDHLQAGDQTTFLDRLRKSKQLILKRFEKSDIQCYLLGIAVFAGVAAAIGALFMPGKRIRRLLALAATAGGLAVMLIYLGMEGRLPMRAVLVPAFPALALTFGLLPASMPKTRASGAAMWALAAVMAVVVAINLKPLMPHLLKNEADEAFGSAFTDMEEYALLEPESLFIFDSTVIGADTRAFPSYPDGMPHNITFWGGWGMRSPESIQLFQNHGIDLMNFPPETFLREDVYVVSGRVDPPPTLILQWLQEKVDPSVECMLASEYNHVYLFQFYIP